MFFQLKLHILGYFLLLSGVTDLDGATFKVGPGQEFGRIEDAYDRARSGDTIEVHALKDDEAYRGVALQIKKSGLRIIAKPAAGRKTVPISGEGTDYTGIGNTPRAIFQVHPGADDGLLEGFELHGATNSDGHNGAGVRVWSANRVTIRGCDIHDNDMGIMSSGDGTLATAQALLIERCKIYRNGSVEKSGLSHNLYLGGTSVVLRFCEVFESIDGHNVKSRAHHTRVEHCYVHDSANREFDLVDDLDTEYPASHAVLLGNLIVKAGNMAGNKTVVHFGQDGGREHLGTLYLFYNTILTAYISPVADLSAPGCGAVFRYNFIGDNGEGQKNQVLLRSPSENQSAGIIFEHNWITTGFKTPTAFAMDLSKNDIFKSQDPVFDRNSSKLLLTPQLKNRKEPDFQKSIQLLPPVPGLPNPLDPLKAWHDFSKEASPLLKLHI